MVFKVIVIYAPLSILISIAANWSNGIALIETVGTALGLVLFPFILTSIVKGFNLILKREFSDQAFTSTYTVAWLLFILPQVMKLF